MTTTSLSELHIDHRLSSAGDARLWVAPVIGNDDDTVVPALTFTADGRTYAIHLSTRELENLSEAADLILTAQPDDISNWLGDAADAIRQQPQIVAQRGKTAVITSEMSRRADRRTR